MNVYVIEFDFAARQQSMSTWEFSHDAFWQILQLCRSFMMSVEKMNFLTHCLCNNYFYTKK